MGLMRFCTFDEWDTNNLVYKLVKEL